MVQPGTGGYGGGSLHRWGVFNRNLIEAGWLLVVILAPLWVNLWGTQPFELAKAALVRSFAALLLSASLSFYFLHRHPREFANRITGNPLLGPVLALAAMLTVATAAAVDPALSLWGSHERSQGLLTLLSYLALCLVVSVWLRTQARLQRLLVAMAATGALLSAMGLLQWLGLQPLPLVTDARSAVFATLGRSNFLGDYLAMLTPVTLALLMSARQRRWRLALAGVLLGQWVVLGLTQARGAWLAAAVGLAVFALLVAGKHLPRPWRRIATGGIALMAASGPLLVLWLGPAGAGSLAARLVIWRGVAALIAERPWFGYGPDSLALIFPRIFPPELVYYQGRQFFVDRAHNWLLDWAVTTGLLGLLALLAVLAAFALTARRALQRASTPGQRVLLAGAIAAVAAQFAGALVSFDVTPTAAAAWVLMGAVAGCAVPAFPRGRPTPPAPPPAMRRWVLAAVLLLAIGGPSMLINSRMLLADVLARQADIHLAAARSGPAAAAAERAIALWPAEPAYYHALAHARQQQALHNPHQAQLLLAQAEAVLLAARGLRPDGVGHWAALGEFYALVGAQYGIPTLEAARQSYAAAARLAPNHAALYAEWGRFELQAGHPHQAALLLRSAVNLDATHGLAYIHLAQAELAAGRVREARLALQEAARLDPHHPSVAALAREIAGAPNLLTKSNR